MCVCVCVVGMVDLRVWRVDVLDGYSAFNRAQGKARRLSLLVLEHTHTPMLILQRALHFLIIGKDKGES